MIDLTRRAALTVLAAALPLAAFGQEDGADAETAAAPREVVEMAVGAEDAPVTVIEYASLTCPHCARFHADVYPRIKENYVETGRVRFVMRDVYFDRLGLWAAMVARCGGPERYFGIVDRLFARQADWSRAESPADAVSEIFAIGRQAGMTDAEMEACVQDQAFAEALVAEYQKNATADGIEATPSFVIDGQIESNMGYEAFAARLDEALAAAE